MTMIGFDPCRGLEVIMVHLPLIGVYICYARMKSHITSNEGFWAFYLIFYHARSSHIKQMKSTLEANLKEMHI